MSDFSSFTAKQIVDWMLGNDSMPSAPLNIYIALHNGDPSPTGRENEVTGGSYDRVETAASTDWNITGRKFENVNAIVFPQATEAWGTVSHFSLWDGPGASDNPLAVTEVRQSRNVQTNDTVEFKSGLLTGKL